MMTHNQWARHYCSPSWVANTYAQYLQKRADNYSKLLAVIGDSVSLDTDSVNTAISIADSHAQSLGNLVNDKALALGYDLSTLAQDNPLYAQIIADVSVDPQVHQFVSNNYRDADDILTNLYDYLCPNASNPVTSSSDISDDSPLQQCSVPSLTSRDLSLITEIDNHVEDIMDANGLKDTVITLNGGYANLSDIVEMVALDATNVTNDNNVNLDISLSDVNGLAKALSSNVGYTYESLVDEIKANYQSAVTWAAGFKACAEDTIADRLSKFNSLLESSLATAQSKMGATATMIKESLSQKKNSVEDFFSQFMALTSFDKVDSADDLPVDVASTDMSAYTGASPVACLDFSNAINAVSTVAKSVAYATAQVAKTAWGIVKGIFSKVSSFLVRTVSDPYDLDTLDNGSKSGLIDGFQYQNSGTTISKFFLYCDSLTPVDEAISPYISELRSKENSWIKVETIFGEALFKAADFSYTSEPYIYKSFGSGVARGGYPITFTWIENWAFKPYPLNTDAIVYAAKKCGIYRSQPTSGGEFPIGVDFQWQSTSTATASLYEAFGDALQEYSPLYLDTSADESRLAQAYANAAMFFKWFCQSNWAMYSIYQIPVSSRSSGICGYLGHSSSSSVVAERNILEIKSAIFGGGTVNDVSVTNLDFIRSASGYRENSVGDYDFITVPSTLTTCKMYSRANFNPEYLDYTMSIGGNGVWSIVMANWFDSIDDPLEFSYFPYSNNVTNFSEPQYRVKTDDENSDALSKFLTVAIIVVIVAIIAVQIVGLVVRIRRKLYFSKAQRVGVLDNKMWNGGKLTSAEQRKYVRAARKLNKSSLLTKGLSDDGSESLIDRVQSLGSKLDTVYCTATGSSTSPLSPLLPSSGTGENMNETILKSIRG